jgi:KDO2-lipid IV(A) lauroyltransferase
MYYIVYPIFYLLSLLPWRVLYFISDAIYGLVYYLIGYRKKVVMKNLLIAFPEKTEKERKRIARDFYHRLIDTFIEVIKLISISEKQLAKRFSSNLEVVDAFYEKGVNVQLHAGHFFSWEFINLGFSRFGKFPFVGVYMPVSNKVFDKIMRGVRSRYGTILVPAVDFKAKFQEIVTGRYAIGLAADQNPGKPGGAYWVPFFNRLTPFVTGPEKGAKANNTPVIFADFYRIKRGYYHMQFELITDTPREFAEGQLTKVFASYVEKTIRQRPSNYLWSHRRWKWEFDQEKYGHLVVK